MQLIGGDVMKSCAIEDCEASAVGRGMCRKHYTRLWRHGSPDIVKQKQIAPLVERFWSRVRVGSAQECWPWTGAESNGYGIIMAEGRTQRAHRVSVLLSGRDIPAGFCVLHTCDNPACVNPSHLEVGTHAENMRQMSERGRTKNARKTHCPQGHSYDEANTQKWKGERLCRQCNRDLKRRLREQRKVAS